MVSQQMLGIAPSAHLRGDASIGEGALTGIEATVMPQRRVGALSVVSAGAVVHFDLKDRVVVAGMAGRVIRHVTLEG